MFNLNAKATRLKDGEGKERVTPHGVPLLGLGFNCCIVKGEDTPPRSFWMVASTESVDRHGDIIRVEGWKLDSYLKTPVILWGHDHSIPAVGTTLDARVDTKAKTLELLWNFPEEIAKSHPLSNTIYDLYDNGVLRASSVGFAPTKWKDDHTDEEREELGLGDYGVEFLTQDLYEDSAVNVPANQDALAMMRSKGIDTTPLEGMWTMGTVIEIQDEKEETEIAAAWDDYLSDELSDSTPAEPKEAPEITLDDAVERLTEHGYEVIAPSSGIAPDEDILTLTEPETVLELEPEPAIDEAELKEALAEAYQSKVRAKIKQTIKERINHLLGIVEE